MEYTKKKFCDIPELDRKIIEGVPWAEKMREVLENGLNTTFLYWCQIVLNMGEKDEVLNNWVSVFIETYEDTCCDLVCDMEYIHGKLVDKIEQLLQKVQQSCKTLQIEMPVFGNKQLSLCQEQYQLEKHVEKYDKLIEVRMRELNKLRKKELELCNSLGKEPRIFKDTPLPSSEEIEQFQRHIERMETEKFNRLEKFISTKEEMLDLIRELNIQPSSSFEKEVFSSDDSEFMVTDDNMKQLEELQKNLHKKLQDVKAEVDHLRNKVDDLWNLLDVNLKEREDFRQKYTGSSVDVLDALRLEVKRCEELKKANIKVFIDKLREELVQIWEKCHCSHSMRTDFGFFYSDCYNEDLLELHEVEQSKWKKYYAENKELLSLLEKHKYLWNKMIELEENATGPDRYNNRGGQLLKEEKERNKLAKQIPQIEEMLEKLAEKYKQHYNLSFTTYGQTVHEYITNLHDDRENVKKLKLSARKLHKEQTMMLTPAKSAISLFPSTSNLRSATPLTATKRRLATPITDNNKKKAKRVLSEVRNNRLKKTPIPTIKITNTSSRSKRLSVERQKRLDKIRRLSSNKSRANPNETFSTDYGDFQTELSSRGDCRSTILPTEMPATPLSTRTLTPRTPAMVTRHKTLRTPGGTPRNKDVTHKTPELSTAKSNLKLIF